MYYSKQLEDRDLPVNASLDDDMEPLNDFLDSGEPTGPPFGIVLNGHSLVSEWEFT